MARCKNQPAPETHSLLAMRLEADKNGHYISGDDAASSVAVEPTRVFSQARRKALRVPSTLAHALPRSTFVAPFAKENFASCVELQGVEEHSKADESGSPLSEQGRVGEARPAGDGTDGSPCRGSPCRDSPVCVSPIGTSRVEAVSVNGKEHLRRVATI